MTTYPPPHSCELPLYIRDKSLELYEIRSTMRNYIELNR